LAGLLIERAGGGEPAIGCAQGAHEDCAAARTDGDLERAAAFLDVVPIVCVVNVAAAHRELRTWRPDVPNSVIGDRDRAIRRIDAKGEYDERAIRGDGRKIEMGRVRAAIVRGEFLEGYRHQSTARLPLPSAASTAPVVCGSTSERAT